MFVHEASDDGVHARPQSLRGSSPHALSGGHCNNDASEDGARLQCLQDTTAHKASDGGAHARPQSLRRWCTRTQSLRWWCPRTSTKPQKMEPRYCLEDHARPWILWRSWPRPWFYSQYLGWMVRHWLSQLLSHPLWKYCQNTFYLNPYEIGSISIATCQVSGFRCQVSGVICHKSFFSFTKCWSLLVKSLLSTGPTPSSYVLYKYYLNKPRLGVASRALRCTVWPKLLLLKW